MSDVHPFDRATALEPLTDGGWRAETSDAYWNMVGPFGGWIAALLFKAAFDHPERQGEPIALTINFCAPVAKGEVIIDACPARTNRSTQHFTMSMRQGDATVATGTAMFGARPDTFEFRPVERPAAAGLDSLARIPAPGDGWIQRYDLRFAEGGFGWGSGTSETGSARSLLWIADDPPRSLDFVALAAICDIFFGRIVHVRQRMVPFGTVTMTAYFHATGADLARQGSAPILGHADARIFDRGFHDQSAELWGADGRLLATSHQLVYYRDPS
jgi:hypothetical protein